MVNLLDENSEVIISFPVRDIVERYYNKVTVNNQIGLEEATFTIENDIVKLGILFKNFLRQICCNINYGVTGSA